MILRRFNVERVTEDPAKIKALQAEGYVPVDGTSSPQPQAEPRQEIQALDKRSKADLVALAYEAGVDNAQALTKAELIEILKGDEIDG